jgi:hypothetical protein
VCRELLFATRFGDLGPSSRPHLDHLADCAHCREEVGFDRALVQQLRHALAERVRDTEPPARAWETILERARTPEPSRRVAVWQWSAAIIGRLRVATAMAGTGLALILALNMDVVPVPTQQPDAVPVVREASTLEQVPRMTTGRTGLMAYVRLADKIAAAAQPTDQELGLTRAVPRLQPRVSVPATEEEVQSEQSVEEEREVRLRVTIRPIQTPEPGATAVADDPDSARVSVAPARSAPGEPS